MLSFGASETAHPNERPKQEHLIGADLLDRLVDAILRGADADGMQLAELVGGRELIEPRPHRVDPRFPGGKREADDQEQQAEAEETKRVPASAHADETDRFQEASAADNADAEPQIHEGREEHPSRSR